MSIRIARGADIPQILAIYAPYVENTAYSFEYTVPTLAEFTQRFADITRQFPWLVWEEHGRVLGYAYGSAPFQRAAYSWCAEVSIYLAPEIHGRGVGKALYAALETLLARQGYQLVYSIVTSSNESSLLFHEAVGYERLAAFPDCGFKHGAWQGITWLQKRLKSVEIPTSAPTPWGEFVKDDRNFTEILDNLTLS